MSAVVMTETRRGPVFSGPPSVDPDPVVEFISARRKKALDTKKQFR
jgi:hypothetical protein